MIYIRSYIIVYLTIHKAFEIYNAMYLYAEYMFIVMFYLNMLL